MGMKITDPYIETAPLATAMWKSLPTASGVVLVTERRVRMEEDAVTLIYRMRNLTTASGSMPNNACANTWTAAIFWRAAADGLAAPPDFCDTRRLIPRYMRAFTSLLLDSHKVAKDR